ncbi:hypothetical protein ABPG75_004868 [Micractinium tetrahymenae]
MLTRLELVVCRMPVLQLSALPRLRALTLGPFLVEGPARLDPLSAVRGSLTEFSVDLPHAGDLPAALSCLTSLARLRARVATAGNVLSWEHLSGQLTSLDIDTLGISLEELPEALSRLSRLQSLVIKDCRMQHAGFHHLPARLTSLKLGRCPWRQLPSAICAHAELRCLDITDRYVRLTAGLHHLSGLRRLTCLHLGSIFCAFPPEISSSATALQELSLELQTEIGASFERIAGLQQLTRLGISALCRSSSSGSLTGREPAGSMLLPCQASAGSASGTVIWMQPAQQTLPVSAPSGF